MNINIFEQQLSRLKIAFGAQAFNQEKAKMVWAELRSLPDKQAIQIIDWAIGEFNPEYPPKISHFREEAERQQKKLKEFETIKTSENWKKEIVPRPDGDGLKRFLDSMQTKSLLDAIKKTKQG